jgi:Ca2+-binding RTX toxin-like protein
VGSPLEHVVAAGSLVEPAGAPAAHVAGSYCVWDGAAQPYTSLGPTPDGRAKPDLRAPDAARAATSPYHIEGGCRGAGFSGTSAAAAHAAGAAAAVDGAMPQLSPASLKSFLLARLLAGRLWLRAFPDVAPDAAYAVHAEAAWHRGAFSGEAGAPLRAGEPVRRGEVARHVLETMRHGGHLPPYRGFFSDLSEGDPRTPWIEHLAEHGAVDRGGAYRPDDALTRAEAAELVLRALGHGDHLPSHQGYFDDVEAATPRAGWIEHAFEHGIVSGGADRLFRPSDPLVRGELVQWLTKAWRLRWFAHVPAGLVNDVVVVGDDVWMTHEGIDAVLPYSLLTGQLGEPVPVGVDPRELDVTADGARLVVTNPGSGDLSIVSVAERRETHRIAVSPNSRDDTPYSIAIAANGRALITTTTFGLFGYTSRVIELDLATLELRDRPDIVPEVTEATYVVPSGDRRRLFVAVGGVTHGPVYAYDSGTDSRVGATATGGLAGYVASDRRGSTVAVGPASLILNGSLTLRKRLSGSSFGVGVSPGGGTLYTGTSAGLEFFDLESYARREPTRPLVDTIDDAIGNFRWLYSPVARMEVAPDGTFIATVTDHGFSLVPTGVDGPDPYTGDTTPPETRIDSGPSGTVAVRQATLAFSASEPDAVLQTSLDGAPWFRSTSPRTVRDLADGVHTFRVRAIDGAGNLDVTPAERVWTVGQAPPGGGETPPPSEGGTPSGAPADGGGSGVFSPVLIPPSLAPAPPRNARPPRVRGRTRVASTLRADPGEWHGDEPLSRRSAWQRCDATGRRCAPIALEGAAYRLRAADAGRRLRVVVRTSNAGGAATALSPVTAVVQAARGSTLILGSARDDLLTGTPGPDVILGGRGRDRLRGGRGRDRLLGGRGDDEFFTNDRTPDRLDGGPGRDRARFDASDGLVGVERRLHTRSRGQPSGRRRGSPQPFTARP